MKLRYLFVATLLDGTVIKQTQKDVCPTDSKRTAYWDLVLKDQFGNGVLDEEGKLTPRPDLKSFMLVGPEQRFTVDLVDGHFEIDGQRVGTIDGKPMIVPPPDSVLSLIYFRRRKHHFHIGNGKPTGESCEFHFGWQAAPTGHSQTLILE